jgi:hypothetical protein
MKKFALLYTFLMLCFIINAQRIEVAPDIGALDAALASANDGDTLVLQSNGSYSILDVLLINKKVTIVADVIDTLPGLDDLPVIDNIFQVSPVFDLKDGANLSLIGIDVNASTAPFIFSCSNDTGAVLDLYVNRCRLHNSTNNILDQVGDLDVEEVLLQSCVIKNSFVYDNGEGHGFYTKNYRGGSSEYVFENITFWNLGQQFNWMRSFPESATQVYTFNHMTGYYLSTSADNKELFGNADAAGEAALVINFKNNILHTQVSTADASLWFDNTSGRHNITINNNVLYNVKPIVDRGGTTNKSNNQEVDPQFADPDNGDFTVGNADLYTAADDGKIIGALYWHPDFVDDFSDLPSGQTTGIARKIINKVSVNTYPNPFNGSLNFDIDLKEAVHLTINLYSTDGRLVKTLVNNQHMQGVRNLSFDTGSLDPGVYLFEVKADNYFSNGIITKL